MRAALEFITKTSDIVYKLTELKEVQSVIVNMDVRNTFQDKIQKLPSMILNMDTKTMEYLGVYDDMLSVRTL